MTGAGNVVSGNDGTGLSLNGVSANTVAGNLVGLDPTAVTAIPNGVDGINLVGSATGNTIGGTTAAARNVASGNSRYGIYLANAVSNQVAGNYVGLNGAGTGAVPNGGTGVYLAFSTTGNTIGGATAGSGNVVSGNGNSGIGLAAPRRTQLLETSSASTPPAPQQSPTPPTASSSQRGRPAASSVGRPQRNATSCRATHRKASTSTARRAR